MIATIAVSELQSLCTLCRRKAADAGALLIALRLDHGACEEFPLPAEVVDARPSLDWLRARAARDWLESAGLIKRVSRVGRRPAGRAMSRFTSEGNCAAHNAANDDAGPLRVSPPAPADAPPLSFFAYRSTDATEPDE